MDIYVKKIFDAFEGVDIHDEYLLDTTAEEIANEFIASYEFPRVIDIMGTLDFYYERTGSIEVKEVLFQLFRKTFPAIEKVTTIITGKNW